KSFSSETEIPLAPITLIYGPNSSGKSSIIQSLLALKQTLIGNNKNGEFISSGECLDLGDFESVISNHDLAENLSISIAFKNGMNIKEYNDEFMFQPIFGADDIRHFSTTYKYSEINPTTNLTSNKNYLSDFKYTVTQSKSDKKIFGIDVLGSKLGSFSFDNNGFDDLATFFNRRDRRSKKLEIPEYYNELISAKILISPILSIPI
ncbi:TPA: AAA family ATPase, partial [Escherichia coli]|nr:AAA family ATPase [Escherichia coli]